MTLGLRNIFESTSADNLTMYACAGESRSRNNARISRTSITAQAQKLPRGSCERWRAAWEGEKEHIFDLLGVVKASADPNTRQSSNESLPTMSNSSTVIELASPDTAGGGDGRRHAQSNAHNDMKEGKTGVDTPPGSRKNSSASWTEKLAPPSGHCRKDTVSPDQSGESGGEAESPASSPKPEQKHQEQNQRSKKVFLSNGRAVDLQELRESLAAAERTAQLNMEKNDENTSSSSSNQASSAVEQRLNRRNSKIHLQRKKSSRKILSGSSKNNQTDSNNNNNSKNVKSFVPPKQLLLYLVR